MAHREQRSNREKKKPKQDKNKKTAGQPAAPLFAAQAPKKGPTPPPPMNKK